MEKHKRTCISCLYLYTDASEPITTSERKTISSKRWDSKYFSFDYFNIKCSRNKLKSFSIQKNTKEEVHKEITIARKCGDWSQYNEGVSVIVAENNRLSLQSIKWDKLAIIIAVLALIVSVIAFIYTLKSS